MVALFVLVQKLAYDIMYFLVQLVRMEEISLAEKSCAGTHHRSFFFPAAWNKKG